MILQFEHRLGAGRLQTDKPALEARMKPGATNLCLDSCLNPWAVPMACLLQLRPRPGACQIACPCGQVDCQAKNNRCGSQQADRFQIRERRLLHRILVVAASSALPLISSAAYSADWVSLGVDARGNVWHVDMASIVRDQNSVTAWKRIEFEVPRRHFRNGRPVKMAFVLDTTSCQDGRSSIGALGLLDAEGSVVAVHEGGDHSMLWPQGAHDHLLKRATALMCSSIDVASH